MLAPALEEEETPTVPTTVPTDTVRAAVPADAAEELAVLLVEVRAVEEVELAVKERPSLRGPAEELRLVLGPEDDGIEEEEEEGAGSGAGVSRSLWILSRAERFSSSRSWTVML